MPRFHVHGACYMVQRRTIRRRFYLKPTPFTTTVFQYVLGYVLGRWPSIRLHEFIAMSNHYHLVVTDDGVELPKFMQELDALLARALNASWGMGGGFWEREQYSAPELPTASDVFEKCVYALDNACKADLVEHPGDWQGATSWRYGYGEPIVVQRPACFFTEAMPEVVTFALTRPRILPELSDAQLRGRIRGAAVARAAAAAKARRRDGRSVAGMAAVLALSHHADPSTPARRFRPNPRVSTSCPSARRAVLQRIRTTLATYRTALSAFIAGAREVVFPYGTYLMRVRYGCACASP